MIASNFIFGLALAAVGVSTALVPGTDDVLDLLLKRQEPGTNAYNCHNTCGQALRQGRFSGDARCTNDVFLTNYKYCLQCAGPDNVDIWSNYGNTLGGYARGCGLATEPLSGKQADVPEAIPAVDPATVTSSSSSSAAAATSSAASSPADVTSASSTAAAATSSSSAASSAVSSTTSSSASTTPAAVPTSAGSFSSSATGVSTSAGITSIVSSTSAVGTNTTAHPTSPSTVPTAGAPAQLADLVGVAVAAALAVGIQAL